MKNIKVILKLFEGNKTVSAEEALRLYEKKEISPFTLYSFEGDSKTEMISGLAERLKKIDKEATPEEKPEESKEEETKASVGMMNEPQILPDQTPSDERVEPYSIEPKAEPEQETVLEEEEEGEIEREFSDEPVLEAENDLEEVPLYETDSGGEEIDEEVKEETEEESETIVEEEKELDIKPEVDQYKPYEQENIFVRPVEKKNKKIILVYSSVILVIVIAAVFLILNKDKDSPVIRNYSQYYANERPKVISTLKQWNRIKVATKKKLTTSDIYTVLTGDALDKDLGAIKWLTDNDAYWDITTNKFDVTSVTFIDRYNAEALVAILETGRYYQNGSLRESASYFNSHYEAYYRLVKKNDKWYISEKPRKNRDL